MGQTDSSWLEVTACEALQSPSGNALPPGGSQVSGLFCSSAPSKALGGFHDEVHPRSQQGAPQSFLQVLATGLSILLPKPLTETNIYSPKCALLSPVFPLWTCSSLHVLHLFLDPSRKFQLAHQVFPCKSTQHLSPCPLNIHGNYPCHSMVYDGLEALLCTITQFCYYY